MHSLTWRQAIEFFKTWQGAALTFAGLCAAAYYGPRKMLETWDWYWDRFRDNAVYFLMQRRKIIAAPTAFHPMMARESKAVELAYTAKEIAQNLNRKESSVRRSLMRLKLRGKVEPYQDGWRVR